ncbi:PDZ domain-containing protein [Peredibacter starrii]|uniref:PDZ domain-containing protein n=1 Tax=Peredibacter starrii TaxID=28202 RepID=A0AAX4HRW7_9BACT|nr:PDZ domain-containing protein [Peredibacter starrii]WPU65915.1 PDZ domain-containing protein [Peredibacter starrii]
MRSIAIMSLIALVGCASEPASYKESKGKTGFSDKIVDQNLRVSTFQGNSATKKEKAQLYAKFHAIELCKEMNQPYTHILTIRDTSFQKEITQTNTYGPTYYYGVSPYYGRYGAYGAGVSMYGAYGPMNTQTTTDVKPVPQFDVYFECVPKAMDARMSFKSLSASDMKNLMQDVKGGVQVEEILPDSPNKNILQVGDIIIKGNGTRVEKVVELYQAHRNSNANQFTVEFFRNGKMKSANVKFLDVTEMVGTAQNEILKEACKEDGIKGVRDICK